MGDGVSELPGERRERCEGPWRVRRRSASRGDRSDDDREHDQGDDDEGDLDLAAHSPMLRPAPVAGQVTGAMDADRPRPYTRRMRIPGRPSGEATVFELIVWATLLTLLFPLVALLLIVRYRLLQAILAGYREGASPAGPVERAEP